VQSLRNLHRRVRVSAEGSNVLPAGVANLRDDRGPDSGDFFGGEKDEIRAAEDKQEPLRGGKTAENAGGEKHVRYLRADNKGAV
jgi:hypothetical protein